MKLLVSMKLLVTMKLLVIMKLLAGYVWKYFLTMKLVGYYEEATCLCETAFYL